MSDDDEWYEPRRLSSRFKWGAAIAAILAVGIPWYLIRAGRTKTEYHPRASLDAGDVPASMPSLPPPRAAEVPEGKVTAIAAGGRGTCALLSTGRVACAEVGDGYSLVEGVEQATQISVGDEFACALELDAVVCFGRNHLRQLGGELRGGRPVVTIARGAAEVRVAGSTGCARMTDGTVQCWGSTRSRVAGEHREPGYREGPGIELIEVDLPKEQRTPAPIPGATGATALLVGLSSACIRVRGDLRCWGLNALDHLGAPEHELGYLLRPTAVPALRDLHSLALGPHMACGLDAEKQPICTGTAFFVPNKSGKVVQVDSLAELEATHERLVAVRAKPRRIPELDGATAFSLGDFYACALRRDRTVVCWEGDVATPIPGLAGAVAIATGGSHSCALLDDGRVRCWTRDNPSPQDAIGLPH